MGLRIVVSKYKSYPLVKITGRVIGVDDKRFSMRLEVLYKKKDQKIIVDFSDTDFIDSHGVGIVVYYHTLFMKSGRVLYLLNANPNPVSYMARLLEMTNLNRVLNVVTTLDQIQ